VTELPQVSLDEKNEYRDPEFKKTSVVAEQGQFNGKTCRVFDYTLPDDVLAIKHFEIYFEFFGGAIGMTHLSPTHQSFEVVSMRNNNAWHFEEYKEEHEDDDPIKNANSKGGYKDILANAKGGDTVQLWIETNGYAFARNIKA